MTPVRIGMARLPQYGWQPIYRTAYMSEPHKIAVFVGGDEAHPDEVILTLSVNLTDQYDPPDDFFWVKVWSENERFIPALRGCGLFEDTGKRAPAGYATAELWKLIKAGKQ